MNEMPLLSIENVTVEFDGESALMEAVPENIKRRFGWESKAVRAVDDVSLEIGEEDVVAVIGESGSGKTTLGKTAVGLQEPTHGTVKYRGHDIWELQRQSDADGTSFSDVRRALQIVHQDPGAALNPYQTVESILTKPLTKWYPELSHADRRERILSVLQEVGMTPEADYIDRYPHELSGGEQQRITLLRAMLVEPDLILADEPVSALDPSLRISLMDLMLALRKALGTSFLFVSHNIQHARYLAERADGRIAVMYLGEIVEIGPATEVLQNPSHPYTQTLLWATLPSHPSDARAKLEAESPLRSLDVPDLTDLPSGCRFHPRCPNARETCHTVTPELDGEDDAPHRTACFRDDPEHEYWEAPRLDGQTETELPN